jgi:hypothetical protein
MEYLFIFRVQLDISSTIISVDDGSGVESLRLDTQISGPKQNGLLRVRMEERTGL